MLKVIYAFMYQGKTYLPGTEVNANLFLGKEAILQNFLKTGFLVEVGQKSNVKPVVKDAPASVSLEAPKPVKVPKAVEINTQEDLRKVIEEKPEKKPEATKLEVKPVVENEVTKIETVEEKPIVADESKIEVQPPTPTRGRARRN
jgi:hypothetical protein